MNATTEEEETPEKQKLQNSLLPSQESLKGEVGACVCVCACKRGYVCAHVCSSETRAFVVKNLTDNFRRTTVPRF